LRPATECHGGFRPRRLYLGEREDEDFTRTLGNDIEGLKIGIPGEYFSDTLDSGIAEVIQNSLREFEQRGAKLVDISLPHTHLSVPAYYVIAPAEASTNLSRYDGVRYGHRCENPADLHDLYTRTREEGFGTEVKRRILIGTYALSAGYYDAYYRKAQQIRRLIQQDFVQAFSEVDVIMGPTTPHPAWQFGAKSNDPVAMYLEDIFTLGVNLAGLPAMSIPAGFHNNMPVGLQLIGDHFAESKLLNVGHQYQQWTDWHQRTPALPTA
jgi:aspartyl-tRNA(Asn)/glutamyl-tRNA(Gln) amidotransferase subunit A